MDTNLTKQIEGIERRIKDLDKQVKDNTEEMGATESRIRGTEKRIEDLKPELERAREERQQILVDGIDSQKIKNLIKEIRDEVEEKEDELIGLQNRLGNLKVKGARLVEEKTEVEKGIPKAKLIHFAKKYNEIASTLGPVVKEICELRYILGEHIKQETIISPTPWAPSFPKLFEPHEEIPENINHATFFNFRAWDEDYTREERNKLGLT